jgi:predicted Fe-Mo cluster-binding NifX family protein
LCHGELKEVSVKIAAVSDDELTISQHFGRASFYVVLTVEEGKVVAKETRKKAGHHTFAAHPPSNLAAGERHGYDAGSQSRHQSMAEAISDCQMLLAGGMGWGAYDAMKDYGIEPIVTDVALSRWQATQSDGAPALNQMKGRS